MTDSPMVSERAAERNAVLRERMADAKRRCAMSWAADPLHISQHFAADDLRVPCGACLKEAAQRYPLPKVTRPRTKTDSSGVEWRIVDEDCLEYRDLPTREWRGNAEWLDLTVERALLIADLANGPTEWVEEEG